MKKQTKVKEDCDSHIDKKDKAVFHREGLKVSLHLSPITLKKANDFVAKHHRHHKPTRGHKFSIACVDENEIIRGVVIAGRPVSRYFDNDRMIEVTRLCTDCTRNVCSMLYSAACRAAKAMGYNEAVTYILKSESGTSLKASGFVCEGEAGGLEWSGVRKPKEPLYPAELKTRWRRLL